MIYMVTGFMRCGTSMMMQCLEAGGLEAAYNPVRDDLAERMSDSKFHPNRGGLYELTRSEYQEKGFPGQEKYQGKLIKCLAGGLGRLAEVPGGYKIVMMLRHPEEVRQSYTGFFPHSHMETAQVVRAFRFARRVLEGRQDFQYEVVRYRSVISDPEAVLTRLKESLGLPIDVEAAAAKVDPSLCHFTLEKLTPGA